MLAEIGYADALIAYETPNGLMLIDGHLRAETTPDMEVPVLITDLNEEEADKLLATLDPLGSMARSDKDTLGELLTNINLNETRLGGILQNIKARSEFETEYIAPQDLHPHPRNYVKHPDDQIEHLAESIRENGLYRNIVVANDDTILAGHGVVQAAIKVPLESVAVIRLDIDPYDIQALKLLASDNELSHLGEADDRALTEMLKQIKETSLSGLLGTGYDDRMLANLLMVTRDANEIADFDAAAEWVGMPDFEPYQDRLQLTLSFDTEDAVNDFISLMQKTYSDFSPRKRSPNTWASWYPPREREDIQSVKFTAGDSTGSI